MKALISIGFLLLLAFCMYVASRPIDEKTNLINENAVRTVTMTTETLFEMINLVEEIKNTMAIYERVKRNSEKKLFPKCAHVSNLHLLCPFFAICLHFFL